MGWFKKKKKKDDKVQAPAVSENEDIIPENKEPEKKEPENIKIDEETDIENKDIEEEQKDKTETAKPGKKKEKQGGLFSSLKKGLSKTREVLTTDIDELFLGKRKVDDELLEEIEELLITSDLGVQTTMSLMEQIEKQSSKISDAEDLKNLLKSEIYKLINGDEYKDKAPQSAPHIIMVVGVNGVGKTTTIGKLAAKFQNDNKKVLIAAADTFRAAAVEQVTLWSEKAGADIVKHRENADPAAVAYDSIEAANARKKDYVIIDTAGRLHTKVNLMEELKKIKRAIGKAMPQAPHEILLVLDATTGQNALSQAKQFHDAIGVTGIALTKLDGTAKGGVVISICNTLEIPLKYIGVGEKINDLQVFEPEKFIDALFA